MSFGLVGTVQVKCKLTVSPQNSILVFQYFFGIEDRESSFEDLVLRHSKNFLEGLD